MRAVFALAILFLCVSSAAPEPEYSSLLPGSFHIGDENSLASLVEIETSAPRGDRQTIAVPPVAAATTQQANPAAADSALPASESPLTEGDAIPETSVSLDQVCSALLTSAQDNNLPVAFFANLIWQESRLRDDAVSPKGALGIAQFMPQVAVASGLANPFDPLQALPASARMLHELRDQFGNLGLVAAAYNAGAKRVLEWLQRRRTLPRETRGYVMHITGQSVEEWQKTPLDDGALQFARRLPCRDLPAFAQLELAQQQVKVEQAQAKLTQSEQPAQRPQPQPAKLAASGAEKRGRVADGKRGRGRIGHEEVRVAGRDRHAEKREVKEHLKVAQHGKHRRA